MARGDGFCLFHVVAAHRTTCVWMRRQNRSLTWTHVASLWRKSTLRKSTEASEVARASTESSFTGLRSSVQSVSEQARDEAREPSLPVCLRRARLFPRAPATTVCCSGLSHRTETLRAQRTFCVSSASSGWPSQTQFRCLRTSIAQVKRCHVRSSHVASSVESFVNPGSVTVSAVLFCC